jgi:hypothetical protein
MKAWLAERGQPTTGTKLQCQERISQIKAMGWDVLVPDDSDIIPQKSFPDEPTQSYDNDKEEEADSDPDGLSGQLSFEINF